MQCSNIQRTRSLTIIAMLSAILLLTGCETEIPKEQSIAEVDRVLEVRKQAIDNKDIALYRSIILPEYSSSGVPFQTVIDDIERLFDTEQSIEFKYQKAQPTIAMNTARVTHMIEYHFAPSGKADKIRETIMLRRVNDKWYISAGIALGMGG